MTEHWMTPIELVERGDDEDLARALLAFTAEQVMAMDGVFDQMTSPSRVVTAPGRTSQIRAATSSPSSVTMAQRWASVG